MKTLADYIIRKNVPLNENPALSAFRGKVGIVQGWISIVISLLLFAIKLFFGLVSNSIALIADAFHTLSDLASSAIVVFGFKMSSKPADTEHPFGHGRAETIASLCIAILIGFAGFEFLKTSIVRLMYIEMIQASKIILAVVIITIILKEAMARLSYSLGEAINSDTLKADAIHHRTDMFSSILVLIAFAGAWTGYPKLDAIMGLGVAGLMLYSAYGVARNAIDDLLGKPVDPETIYNIKSIAMQVEGILNVHDIVVHSYGAQRFISLHIEIPEGKSPESMHEMADQVEKVLTDNMAADVVTHVDPVTVSGEEFDKICKIISANMKTMDIKTTIQDLRIVKNQGVKSIYFQIPVSVDFQKKDQFKTQCALELQQYYHDCKVTIEFKSQMTME
jgi:cation diffusion facilitator family transporter